MLESEDDPQTKISRLNGNSQNPMDVQGRVSLPSRFRKLLSGKDLVLVRTRTDGLQYLRLFAQEDYDAWLDEFFVAEGGYHANDPKQLRMKFRLKRDAESIKYDNSYRLRISQTAKDFAGFTNLVDFTGMDDSVFLSTPEVAEQLGDVEIM